MPLADRKSIPGIEEKRADIIVAGLVVLEAVMGFLGAAEITVSDEGLLHGALLEYSEGTSR
jgi:exopolyphosphatase/guanosine-5'-triphosphate,3'-diphosphate pyrophosphatase